MDNWLGRKDGRMDGSVAISLCNFVGEGIKIMSDQDHFDIPFYHL